ncbi:MAG: peptidylprolyl isomerase [Jaaginema sp. PMC 1079.18]|nr:peptidylprolyl isomerase [Jaaginema sp. PMC 1080.18]MEC4850821.1 peptidylprolyl isomerase [Jaaginema sp. PMC 1079.18]MEC4867863.1 peptidylprolyl isomerase [Jaaginema sp. PMC 1078.18]
MRKQFQRWLVLTCCVALLSLSGVGLVGCDSQSANSSATTTSNTENRTITSQASNSDMTQLPKLEGKATVVMTVNGSPITIEVDGDNAPITAGNFVDLVERGFYDGLTFHRVVKSPQPFVAQGGDPEGTGMGSFIDPDTKQPRYIPLEIKPQGADEPIYGKTLKQAGVTASPVLAHTRGAVAMARSQMPNSASSQFYFALTELQFLDGDYAVFGYVTEGMDAVDAIAQGNSIDTAEVTAGGENLKK